jgi:hypothetical protein
MLISGLDQSQDHQNSFFTSVLKFKLTLKNNVYSQNFAGSKASVALIEGFPLVQSSDEVYENNENWF